GDTDPTVLLVRGHAARAVNDMALAIETFRGVAERQPCLGTATANLLMAMIADDGSSIEAIRAQATRWARACAPSANAGARSRRGARERLRIGYVSPDFRRHSVAFFLRPLLEAHDRDRVEVFLYSTGTQSDDYTRWFAERAGPRWRDVAAADDDQAANRIRGDGIDVLVDLAGHTEGHRLRVFARRPAPVQVSWLGWPSTTGVEAIDWRLTDAIADPPGAERECSEQLVRLEGGFLIWRAPAEAPSTARRRDGHPPTFGSFNQAFKLSDATLRLWARVLAAVPGARLLIKCASLGVPEAAMRLRSRFAAVGGESDRLEIVGRRLPFADHFALYARVDVGLDPLPYNGTTTTLEALWMGVPVITRAGGDRHAARVGASLLTHAGMNALVAADDDAYVALARTLMSDPTALFAQRARRREVMARSRICDAAAFARTFETALLAL
ncbi:MAG: hypothetical protein FJX57_24240, partial [Alphaproteobacteria bacterium]|nr:hypothetical protein [Alphaproteobacteria bacterium]